MKKRAPIVNRADQPLAGRAAGFCLAAALLAGGCTAPQSGLYGAADGTESFQRSTNAVPDGLFTQAEVSREDVNAKAAAVERFSAQSDGTYRMGPGDTFAFMVRGRPDISVDEVIVSPDGKVSLPRVGILEVSGQTLETVTGNITERLYRYYESPEVTLVMKTYNNNKVYILGRVANPGVVHFNGRGTLLEALSLAGGLPVDTTRSWLSRCMIVRGNDTIIWIDLKDLLDNGNMMLNTRLLNGDVIYIPQSLDQVAYVMGEVNTPGVLQLRSKMTVLDAIMYRGGVTDDAVEGRIYLVRGTGPNEGAVEEIDLQDMYVRGDLRKNYILQDGDIVYVSEKKIAKYNYYVEQLIPTLRVMNLTAETAESLGVMQELRNQMWGQEGFVNGSGN